MARFFKLALLLLPLALLLAVGVGTVFQPGSGSALTGVVRATPRPHLSASSFWKGTFQSKAEGYFDAELAFKAVLVRSENSLNLLAFREISAHTDIPVVLGKQDTLFEKNYIDNLNAVCDEKNDPPPPAPGSVEETSRRMGQAARAFSALGIDFLFVFYPSKAWLLADRVPERFKLAGGKERAEAGYLHLLAELRGNGVPVIDGLAALMELRRTNPALPLYNRGGTHWTDAAACSVAQRIVASLAKEGTSDDRQGGLDCVLGPAAPAQGTDMDIAGLSNLWSFERFKDRLPSVTPNLTQRLRGGPPSTLVMGTSFSDHLVRLLTQAHAIRNVGYFEYYRHANARRFNFKREFDKRQLVIFDQWQASRLTVNVTEFVDDLERRDPRFRAAMQAAAAP